MSKHTRLDVNVNLPNEDTLIRVIAEAFDSPEAVVISWLSTAFQHGFNSKAAYERLAAR